MNEHANSPHPRCLFESSTLISPQVSETLAILFCFAELFTNYQWIQNGRFYGVVQVTGKSSVASKQKGEFTLRAANGIEEISKIFFFEPTQKTLIQVLILENISAFMKELPCRI
jgi:hypothetical protein